MEKEIKNAGYGCLFLGMIGVLIIFGMIWLAIRDICDTILESKRLEYATAQQVLTVEKDGKKMTCPVNAPQDVVNKFYTENK